MFITSTKNQIYTSVSGTDYAINGLPFPTAELIIPVVTNFVAEGNYKISATQLQGLEDYNVSLIDNTTGFIADLKTTPNVTLILKYRKVYKQIYPHIQHRYWY